MLAAHAARRTAHVIAAQEYALRELKHLTISNIRLRNQALATRCRRFPRARLADTMAGRLRAHRMCFGRSLPQLAENSGAGESAAMKMVHALSRSGASHNAGPAPDAPDAPDAPVIKNAAPPPGRHPTY